MSVYQSALSGEAALFSLLQNNVSVNKIDIDGNSALHYLCSHGKAEAVELLLKYGAKVDIVNKVGDTALHRAADKGHSDIISSLIGHGAAVDIRNNENQLPLQLAVRNKHKKAIKLLRAVNLKGTSRFGYSWLKDTFLPPKAPPIVPILSNSSQTNESQALGNTGVSTPLDPSSTASSLRSDAFPFQISNRGRSKTPSVHSDGGGETISEMVLGMLPSFLQTMITGGAGNGSETNSNHDDDSSSGGTRSRGNSFGSGGMNDDSFNSISTLNKPPLQYYRRQEAVEMDEEQLKAQDKDDDAVGQQAMVVLSSGLDDEIENNHTPVINEPITTNDNFADQVVPFQSVSDETAGSTNQLQQPSVDASPLTVADMNDSGAGAAVSISSRAAAAPPVLISSIISTKKSKKAGGVSFQIDNNRASMEPDEDQLYAIIENQGSGDSEIPNHIRENSLNSLGAASHGSDDTSLASPSHHRAANCLEMKGVSLTGAHADAIESEESSVIGINDNSFGTNLELENQLAAERAAEHHQHLLERAAAHPENDHLKLDADGNLILHHHHHHGHHSAHGSPHPDHADGTMLSAGNGHGTGVSPIPHSDPGSSDQGENKLSTGWGFNFLGKSTPTVHPSAEFHAACIAGDLSRVKVLLYRGIDVNILNKQKENAILLACVAGQELVVDVLIQHGANIQLISKSGMSAIAWAQEQVRLEQLLLVVKPETGFIAWLKRFFGLVKPVEIDPDLVDDEEDKDAVVDSLSMKANKTNKIASAPDTPVLLSAAASDAGSEAGSNDVDGLPVDTLGDGGTGSHGDKSSHHGSGGSGKSNKTKKKVPGVRACADLVIQSNVTSFSELRNAVLLDIYSTATGLYASQLVTEIIESGGNINIKNASNQTYDSVLHLMCSYGIHKGVELLLKAKANPNILNARGDSPLHIACCYGTGKAMRGKGQVVRLLIEYGADADVEDTDGNTALHYAAFHDRDDVLPLLLAQKGVRVNVKNRKGDTPLHKAAWNNKEVAVELLLQHGADMNIRNLRGKTPLQMANLNRNELCAELLDETNDCWSILVDPNSLRTGHGSHIKAGDMLRLLNRMGVHRSVQLNHLTREQIISIQNIMKPIAKRQFTRLLHNMVVKKYNSSSGSPNKSKKGDDNASTGSGGSLVGKSVNGSSSNSVVPFGTIHEPISTSNNLHGISDALFVLPSELKQSQLTPADWNQLLRLSNDRCPHCGDLLKPVKINKSTYHHDILKVTNSTEIQDVIRLKRYNDQETYCQSYIPTLNAAWFLLHSKHSLLEDKNDDNTFVYDLDTVIGMLDGWNVKCAEDLADLTMDDVMELKEIMRIKSRKEFGRFVRIFHEHQLLNASAVAVVSSPHH